MKGRQIAIVLGVLLVVGGLALFLSRRNSAQWSSTATSSSATVLQFPLNDVSHVTVKSGGSELNLIKKEDVWTVKERADYAADFDKVSALLRKLWELRPVQDVKIGPSQLGRLQLGEPSADANSSTLVDLKSTSDQRLAAVRLGKKSLRESDQVPGPAGGFPVGRYIMAEDGSNRVFLVSETLDEAQTKPEQWLNRDFVKVDAPRQIAVVGSTPGVNWSVKREIASAPWQLVDAKPGEDFDPAKISSVATLFAGAVFADVLAPDAPTVETGLDKPSSARIETFDNFSYELRIGKLMGENYPVLVSVKADLPKERTPAADEKPEDKAKLDQEFQARQKELTDKLAKEQKLGARPYLISKGTIDQLLKERSALMAEKKEASPSPAAAKPARSLGLPSPGSPPSPAKRPN